jgi:hypothetical protein
MVEQGIIRRRPLRVFDFFSYVFNFSSKLTLMNINKLCQGKKRRKCPVYFKPCWEMHLRFLEAPQRRLEGVGDSRESSKNILDPPGRLQ